MIESLKDKLEDSSIKDKLAESSVKDKIKKDSIKDTLKIESYNYDRKLDVVSYVIFGWLADYIVDNTGYSKYTHRQTEKPSRFYISRIPFEGLFFAIMFTLTTLLFYLFLSQGLVGESGAFTQILGNLNILFIFVEIIRFISDVILFIISNSTDIIESTISLESISEYLIELARNNVIIGIILGIFVEIYQIILAAMSELIPDITIDEIQLVPTEELQEILPEQLFNLELLRNVALVILMPLSTFGFLIYRLYYPIYVYNETKRNINNILPQSYLFLYALTKGGLSITAAMEELANAEETYGEVSHIFDDIITQSKYGNLSLEAAIELQIERTSSTELTDFLQGLINILRTGSSVSTYLENKTQEALENEKKEQESYFNTLELLSEAYIIMFVLAPIFIMVLQLVSAMTGGFNRALTQMVPYLHVPAGGFLISLVIYILGKKYTTNNKISKPKLLYQTTHGIEHEESKTWLDAIENVQKNSSFSLLFTTPVVLLYLSFMIQTGVIPLDIEGWNEVPLQATIYGYYVPLLMILIPWSYLYEKEKRRRKRIETQLPAMLNNIQEANREGLTMDEAITTAAQSGEGSFYDSLRESLRKSDVFGNLNYALVEFANKLETPRISQAIDLLARSNRVSGDVSTVMKIIADDFNALYKLKSERETRAKAYVAVIFVSISVSTLVIIAIDAVFFGFVAEQAGAGDGADDTAVDAPEVSSFDSLPTGFFNRILLHTVMMLSLISGIVSGIMENNDPKNGFKYVIILTTATLIAFILVEVLI